MTTKVRMIVYYTGLGARNNGNHTREQFLKLMRNVFLGSDAYYDIFGSEFDPNILENFTFKDWIVWSGAKLIVHEIMRNHT